MVTGNIKFKTGLSWMISNILIICLSNEIRLYNIQAKLGILRQRANQSEELYIKVKVTL